jgi:glycerol-3-phosphate dehydrogenase (NAD(P)+)
MGTACASVLAEDDGHDVRLWVRNPTFASHIAETRENSRLLPGVRIHDRVNVTFDAEQALKNAEIVLVCVPTRGIRSAIVALRSLIPTAAVLVSAVKGIENETLVRPSQMIQELLGQNRPVVALKKPRAGNRPALLPRVTILSMPKSCSRCSPTVTCACIRTPTSWA